VNNKAVGRLACLIKNRSGDLFWQRPGAVEETYVLASMPLKQAYEHGACTKTGSRGSNVPFYSESRTVCESRVEYEVAMTIDASLKISTDIEIDSGWLSRNEKKHEDLACEDQTQKVREAILENQTKFLFSIRSKLYRLASYDFAENRARFTPDSILESGDDLILNREELAEAKKLEWIASGGTAAYIEVPKATFGAWSCYAFAETEHGIFANPKSFTVEKITPEVNSTIKKTSIARVLNGEGKLYGHLVTNETGKFEVLFPSLKTERVSFLENPGLSQRFVLFHAGKHFCVQK
jgi:hypothetical protein